MLAYVSKRLPTSLADQVMIACKNYTIPAQKVRQFCAYYKAHQTSIRHFTVRELMEDPDLWLVSTEEAKKRNGYLNDVYPKHVKRDLGETRSILQCSQCKKHTVDYFEKQTRGADEPMTCFCECLSCGYRWRQ